MQKTLSDEKRYLYSVADVSEPLTRGSHFFLARNEYSKEPSHGRGCSMSP